MTIFRRLAWLGALCAAPAMAAPAHEELNLLEARIVATLGAGIGVPGGPARPLDRRLKLAACPSAPELAVPTPASAVVRCAALGWRIYVPLVKPAVTAATKAEAEPAVRKGDQVEVTANGGGFTVSLQAVAQQDGVPGERVRVRADAKSPPFLAEVAGQGRVVLPAFK